MYHETLTGENYTVIPPHSLYIQQGCHFLVRRTPDTGGAVMHQGWGCDIRGGFDVAFGDCQSQGILPSCPNLENRACSFDPESSSKTVLLGQNRTDGNLNIQYIQYVIFTFYFLFTSFITWVSLHGDGSLLGSPWSSALILTLRAELQGCSPLDQPKQHPYKSALRAELHSNSRGKVC